MKSSWSEEYRTAADKVDKHYRRLRLRLVLVLIVLTILFGTVTGTGVLMKDSIPLFSIFAFAGPIFLIFNGVLILRFLQRLRRTRDDDLRELDFEFRSSDEKSKKQNSPSN